MRKITSKELVLGIVGTQMTSYLVGAMYNVLMQRCTYMGWLNRCIVMLGFRVDFIVYKGSIDGIKLIGPPSDVHKHQLAK